MNSGDPPSWGVGFRFGEDELRFHLAGFYKNWRIFFGDGGQGLIFLFGDDPPPVWKVKAREGGVVSI